MTPIRRHLRSRRDVIDLLRDHPLSRSFRRAIDDPNGSVEVLGGFTPTEGFPYWGVDVTSRHGRTWHVRIVADEAKHCLQIRRADAVDWHDWAGDRVPSSPLMAGEKPGHYRMRMIHERARRRLDLRHD